MAKMLNHMYMFAGLEDSDLAKIENIAELESYSPGDRVFSQGEPADAMFMIQHGAVRIVHIEDDDEEVELAKLGTGSHFGEMSMLDAEPRSGTAISEGYSDIIRIRHAPMIELLESDQDLAVHIYREISRFLCSRLRLTSLDLSYIRSQNPGLF